MAKCPHCLQEVDLSLIVEDIVNRARTRSMGDIKLLVRGKVEDVTDRQIYNAVGFLARYGKIKRLGYGMYSRNTTHS